MRCIALFCILSVYIYANPLQEAINNAKVGSKIELGAGKYIGNIVIDKPLILEGKTKEAHIVGDNNGSVITIKSSNVILKNLSVSGSGDSHEKIDSAVFAKEVRNIEVVDINITDSLFGINLQEVSDSKVISNLITSKPYELGVRGDGIVLWYSHNNLISQNELYNSRDLVAWYSGKNIFEKNVGRHGRYSLHFMYATDNIVRDNFFEQNSVGIFFMYSQGIKAFNNTIKNSVGTFGLGLGLKDCSDFTVENNNIIYNARGVYFDQSPYRPGSSNVFRRNFILYNASALQFQGVREKLLLEDNMFDGNMELVLSDMPKNDAKLLEWSGNYWDDYEGFDTDKNGIGDIPYRHYAYADRLWLYNANVRFFYGTAALDLIGFLSKMAPFSEPSLMITDNEPRIRSEI